MKNIIPYTLLFSASRIYIVYLYLRFLLFHLVFYFRTHLFYAFLKSAAKMRRSVLSYTFYFRLY